MTDPTADAAKLLPCPFCGGVAECKPDEVGSGGQHVPPYWAACRTCKVAFMGHTSEEAASRWNTRPQPAPPADEPNFEKLLAAWQEDYNNGRGALVYDSFAHYCCVHAYRLGLSARPKVEDAEVAKIANDLREAGQVLDNGITKILDAGFFVKAADLIERLTGERGVEVDRCNALAAEIAALRNDLEKTDRVHKVKLAEREVQLATVLGNAAFICEAFAKEQRDAVAANAARECANRIRNFIQNAARQQQKASEEPTAREGK